VVNRLKFILGFLGAYRAARKAGARREDAKLAAARQMIDAQVGSSIRDSDGTARPAFSRHVAALWSDPEAALEGTDVLQDSAWFGQGRFEITPLHLVLLRQMRFAWDGAERGAPMLDPEQPYGRTDLLAQLSEIFATDDADSLARRHVEMFFVLARALKHGGLERGRYTLHNIGADDVREAMRGYGGDNGVPDADLGLVGDGSVTVTDEHLALLRNIEIRWPSQGECEERIERGTYPAAAADPKRPYGDYTYIEVDMARILGCLPPPTDGDEPAVFEPEPALAARLQRLHWQMLGAMQAFVENAEMKFGVYDLDVSA
jgi:hypothetical protein